MPVRITGRHLVVTPEIREYIERKLPRVERYTDRIHSVEFVLEKERYRHRVEARLKAGPVTVTAKAADPDLMKAVDVLADKLERQLAKSFEKLRGNKKHNGTATHKTWAGRAAPVARKTARRAGGPGNSGNHPADDFDSLGFKIFPSRRLALDPMTVSEAAEMLHRSDDDFLCFINAHDRQMNVIYRRKDRNFGLIEPVFE
jgi:putative sigma-54 modulation protein